MVAFLTIALMPIGLIAIYQTAEFQRETLRRSELSLLALTAQAGAPVEQTIERAFGVAEALGVAQRLEFKQLEQERSHAGRRRRAPRGCRRG